jgi:hypothetical protein
MTDLAWVLKKHWHPERRWYARTRAFILILLGHETEICGLCGGKIGVVWTANDPDWRRLSGFPSDGGVLCVSCYDGQAKKRGESLRWVPGPL